MADNVEIIILSPAPEQEEDPGRVEERKKRREQELWSRVRLIPLTARFLSMKPFSSQRDTKGKNEQLVSENAENKHLLKERSVSEVGNQLDEMSTRLEIPDEDFSRSNSPDGGGRESPVSGRSTPTKHGDEKTKTKEKKPSENGHEANPSAEVDEGGKTKSGAGGPEPSAAAPSHSRFNKPMIEDRALQALLASRRRSLENAGRNEPRRKQVAEKTEGVVDEAERGRVSEETKKGLMEQQTSESQQWTKIEVVRVL
ncbi:hypothetical protein SK128_008986 [Halocaridina rubra]|uniref:Uncharacterized protein n=1 Tax=Halocaridina rubra TaxID=373956 RepID=A0AAN8X372_HALRR